MRRELKERAVGSQQLRRHAGGRETGILKRQRRVLHLVHGGYRADRCHGPNRAGNNRLRHREKRPAARRRRNAAHVRVIGGSGQVRIIDSEPCSRQVGRLAKGEPHLGRAHETHARDGDVFDAQPRAAVETQTTDRDDRSSREPAVAWDDVTDGDAAADGHGARGHSRADNCASDGPERRRIEREWSAAAGGGSVPDTQRHRQDRVGARYRRRRHVRNGDLVAVDHGGAGGFTGRREHADAGDSVEHFSVESEGGAASRDRRALCVLQFHLNGATGGRRFVAKAERQVVASLARRAHAERKQEHDCSRQFDSQHSNHLGATLNVCIPDSATDPPAASYAVTSHSSVLPGAINARTGDGRSTPGADVAVDQSS